MNRFDVVRLISAGSILLYSRGGVTPTEGSAGSPDGLSDIIVDALTELLRILFTPIEAFVERFANDLLLLIVGTPYPNTVFGAPTNSPWDGLYRYYWEQFIPAIFLLYGLAVGLVILLESTSTLFSSYHRSMLKRRAVVGLFGILCWWWIAALSLRLVQSLTGFILPDLSQIDLFQTLSFGVLGVLGTVITYLVDFTLFLLLGLVYFSRQLLLYLFVLLMPLLIVFWIPGVGPFSLVSRFMLQLAAFYIPFLFMAIPAALLFRLSHLIGTSFDTTLGGFGAWLAALLIPMLALFVPFVLIWQTGALFLLLTRASYHVGRPERMARSSKMNVRRGSATAQSSQELAPSSTNTGAEPGFSDAPPASHTPSRRERVVSVLRKAVPPMQHDEAAPGDGQSTVEDVGMDNDPTQPSTDAGEPSLPSGFRPVSEYLDDSSETGGAGEDGK